MKGAIVQAYARPNCGSVILIVYVGDKQRCRIVVPAKCSGDDLINGPNGTRIHSDPDALTFVQALRDAALEAKREA